METYKRSEFAAAGISEDVRAGESFEFGRRVLRGLHYQRPPHAQSKLVRVLRGRIFDVAVDLRPDSPTKRPLGGRRAFGRRRKIIYIPAWCAHGFCVLSERAEVVYHTSTEYSPEYEAGVMWNDPALGIDWPVSNPFVSERDKSWPPLVLSRAVPRVVSGDR